MPSRTDDPDQAKSRLSPLAFGMLLAALLAAGAFALASGAAAESGTIEVYKTPTCGCCVKWIEHLEAAGFEVKTTNLPDLDSLKANNGVPPKLASCHTGLIEGYVIEGHVPAADILRLLKEKPRVAGLAVPGMPMGSPGMEHTDSRRHQAYEVIAFGEDTATRPGGLRFFTAHGADETYAP